MYLFIDTETTGKENWHYHVLDLRHWPRLIQLGWIVYDNSRDIVTEGSTKIKPDNFIIPEESTLIHGIKTNDARLNGKKIENILKTFSMIIEKSETIVGHNIDFDVGVLAAEFQRYNINHSMFNKKRFCTMKNKLIIDFCKIPITYNRIRYKWPSLSELHKILFDSLPRNSHNALADVKSTAKCYFKLKEIGIIS